MTSHNGIPTRRRRSVRIASIALVLATGLTVTSAPAFALLTNSFTGRVDATGTKYRSHIFSVVDAGAIDATLDWTNATSANLNLLLYREETGGTWTIVASATSTTTRPEQIHFATGTVGRWKVAAKAITGAADYTLTVQHSPGGTPPPAAVATYSSAFGFKGPAGEYPYGMDFDPTDGTILVGDVWNYRAKRYTTSGDFIRVVTQHADRNELGGTGAPFDVEADPTVTFGSPTSRTPGSWSSATTGCGSKRSGWVAGRKPGRTTRKGAVVGSCDPHAHGRASGHQGHLRLRRPMP